MNGDQQTKKFQELSEPIRKELCDRAWNYFDRHAEQRLKTLNFYIVLSAAISAAAIAIARDFGGMKSALPLTAGLFAITVVFWKLECRNRDLVHHSEEALMLLEDELQLEDESPGLPHRLKMFRREQENMRRIRSSSQSASYWTYSTCFKAIFILFGGGSLLATILIFRFAKF